MNAEKERQTNAADKPLQQFQLKNGSHQEIDQLEVKKSGDAIARSNRRFANHWSSCWLKLSLCQRAVMITSIVCVIAILLAALCYVNLTGPLSTPSPHPLPLGNGSKLVPPNPENAQPPSASHLHIFKDGAVCSDAKECSEIGRNVFLKGGNVMDATIATMFCNGLANMQSMGIGGGFVMNIYKRDERKSYTLDAREITAGAATEDMHLADPRTTNEGALSIAVPGELLGYWTAHKRFGSMPWKDLIMPTIKLCDKGFVMSKHMEDSLVINPRVRDDLHLRNMFVNKTTGAFFRQGSIIKAGKLCDTLRMVAENGGEDMYTGKLGDLLAADLKDINSIITREDLHNYKVRWSDSIPIDLNGDTMYVVPPPASGIILGLIMNILKGYHFKATDLASNEATVRTYHRIVEAFKYSFGRRPEISDPEFYQQDELIRNLTSEEYAERIRLSIDDTRTHANASAYGGDFNMGNEHGTAHLSFLAPNGDAVSVTTSVNFYFGCGLSGKRTGIILNSGMDDFSSPGLKNYFGLPGIPSNYIKPYKRALNSMTPTIITDADGVVKLVIGAAGGTKIPTAVAMAMMRILWFDQTPKEATDAARFHHQLIPNEIQYEYGNMNQIVTGLEEMGHKTSRYHYRGSIICVIYRNGTGVYANADYRKMGEVMGL